MELAAILKQLRDLQEMVQSDHINLLANDRGVSCHGRQINEINRRMEKLEADARDRDAWVGGRDQEMSQAGREMIAASKRLADFANGLERRILALEAGRVLKKPVADLKPGPVYLPESGAEAVFDSHQAAFFAGARWAQSEELTEEQIAMAQGLVKGAVLNHLFGRS